MATTLEAIYKHTPAVVFPLLTTVDVNLIWPNRINYTAYEEWHMAAKAEAEKVKSNNL